MTESPEHQIILSASGPFKTEGAAKGGLAREGLTLTHEVVPYGDGFGLSPKGTAPSPPEVQEKPVTKAKPIEKPVQAPLKKVWTPPVAEKTFDEIIQGRGEIGQVNKFIEFLATDGSVTIDVVKESAMEDVDGFLEHFYSWYEEELKVGYIRVRFNPKASQNDTDDVELSMNGEKLIIKRDTEVIIPEPFREIADHGVDHHFSQRDGDTRKRATKIKTYPYTVIGPATREEYLEQKEAGTKKTMKDFERYGMDVPDDVLHGDEGE